MSTTGLEVFDTTVQKTMEWLAEIDEELGWEDRHRAYQALRSCLHQLRDRLSVDEAAHLAAQLPILIRGIYYEGWDPSAHLPSGRSADDFAFGLGKDLPWDFGFDYDVVIQTFFRVLSRHVDPGIVHHVRGGLAASVRDLWPVPTP